MVAVESFVSLTYDDALPCHHKMVAPLLEAHRLRGTFYTPCSPRFLDEADIWRRVAAKGHELGNHTLFHPCPGPRPWLHEAYDLSRYTPRRWNDEVALANAVLRLIDGRSDRSFGNTCHQDNVGPTEGGGTVAALAPAHFVAARGVHTGRKVELASANWFNLGTWGVDGRSFDEIRGALEDVATHGGWLILTVHGVGPGDHSMHMTEDEHLRLVQWLADEAARVHTGPVRDIVARLRGKPLAGA